MAVVVTACKTENITQYTVDGSLKEPDLKYLSFPSINQALNHVRMSDYSKVQIKILPGMYFEKVIIEMDNITFQGKGPDNTILTFDAHGDTRNADGSRIGTAGSATLTINAKDFKATGLRIENSFDYPGNALKSENDPTRVINTQAVAVAILANSDRVVFTDCEIIGYQDTFLADAGRTIVSGSRIAGHVDFIFGAGQLVIEDSEIISRNRFQKNPTGYITAPSTRIEDPYGMLFQNCRFIKEDNSVPDGSVRLGRPWHPNADLKVSGSAIFRECFMDSHLGPEVYSRISSRDDKGERIWFAVGPDSRFFEYKNTGPGALKSEKRPQLSDRAALLYTRNAVLNNWDPEL